MDIFENIEIRLANEEDIKQIINLRIELLKFYNKDIPNKDILIINTEKFLKEHLNNDMVYYIAQFNNEIIATCSLTIQDILPKPSNMNGIVGKIGEVYTKKEYRRKGIQKKLLSASIELAKKKDCGKIYLEAINPEAIKLYEAFNFKLVNDKFELRY